MADKDINIHVRTPGVQESKQQLDQVAQAINKTGDSIANTAPKVQKASGAFSSFMGFLSEIGILASLATASKKISEFFDNLKTKADEAVKKAQEVRNAYEGLFEAFGAYDEGSRKDAVKNTEQLLIDSAASKEVGYLTIEAYTRQFKEIMPEADYNAGLENALSYAARHGGTATPELIQLMRGWGYNTSQQQDEMYRLIMRASGESGLTDNEMIDLIGRSSPTARQLGWSPQQTISVLSTLASGEIGRNKTMRPAQILEEYAKDPQKALKDYPGLNHIKTVTPITEAMDRAEENNFQQTIEAEQNKKDAADRLLRNEIKPDSFYNSKIRELGRTHKDLMYEEHPYQQFLVDLTKPKNAEDEWAAYSLWKSSLTDQEKKEIDTQVHQYRKEHGQSEFMRFGGFTEQQYFYQILTPKQRYDQLLKATKRQKQEQPPGSYFLDDFASPDRFPTPEKLRNTYEGIKENISSNISNSWIYNNNTYINQTPPDATPRCNGGL